VKESFLQRQILDYLALKGIFHYRNNSGAFDNGRGGFYRFGTKGSPDIICVIEGQYIGIRSESAERQTIRPSKRVSEQPRIGKRQVYAHLFA
jgi:hypothetical protein